MAGRVTDLLAFEGVGYDVGGRRVLTSIDLTVAEGETLVLIGRSGAGKSTALRLINALLRPTRGHVVVGGRSTSDWDEVRLRRGIGYVIQDVGLFPHFTVERNVGLVPTLEGWPAADVERRIDHLLEMVGLAPREFRARYPHQLSGGQRQRVGVARALAADPPLLLLDEPFGALDPVTRWELQEQFLALRRQLGKTAVFVTHDIREALRVGTRIAVLAAGRVEVTATPDTFPDVDTPEARALLATL